MEMESFDSVLDRYEEMPFNGFELQFYPDPPRTTGTKALNLAGSKVLGNEGTFVKLKLTEKQRIAAIRMSATAGGDGDPIIFDAESMSVLDLSGNFGIESNNITAIEIQDTNPPVILQATINFNTGQILVLASEILDTSEADRYNTSKIIIANNSNLPCLFERTVQDNNFSTSSLPNVTEGYTKCIVLSQSKVSSETRIDASITMSEEERYAALRMSAVPGGDGTPLYLRLYPGAFSDVSRSPCAYAELHNETLTIIPDTTPPILKNALIDYSTGIITLSFNETIDSRKDTNFNFSNALLVNDKDEKLSIIASIVSSAESVNFTFTITEKVRARAIRYSGTPGGDGNSILLDLIKAFVLDAAGNANLKTTNVKVTEIPDTVPPSIKSASLNYQNGIFSFNATETIDSTPYTQIDYSKVFISNTSQLGTVLKSLKGSSSENMDVVNIFSQILEATRAEIIPFSGTKGGDSFNYRKFRYENRSNATNSSDHFVIGTAYAIFLPGAIRDVGQNFNAEQQSFLLREVSDELPPEIQNVSIHYGTGTLNIRFSEFLDITPISNLIIQSFSVWNDTLRDNNSLIELQDTLLQTKNDGQILSFLLSESQRVQAIQHSQIHKRVGDRNSLILKVYNNSAKDIAGNAFKDTFDSSIHEIPDTIKPSPISAEIDYSTGILVILADEMILTRPSGLVNFRKIMLEESEGYEAFDLNGANVVQSLNEKIVITLTEDSRAKAIAKSSTSGGDNTSLLLFLEEGAIQDLVGNTNANSTRIELTESADTLPPNVTKILVDFSVGIITIGCTETIDTSPNVLVDLSKDFPFNSSGANDIELIGSVVTPMDGSNITITLRKVKG